MGRCAFNMSFIFLFGTASSIPLSPIGSGSLAPCGFQHALHSTAPVSPRCEPLLHTSECGGSVRVLRTTSTMLLWWEAEWARRWMWACVFNVCIWRWLCAWFVCMGCCPCSAVLHYVYRCNCNCKWIYYLWVQKPVHSPVGVQSVHSHSCCYPLHVRAYTGNGFPQPPSGIHVRFGFVEQMAELQLEVWVDQPSTGEWGVEIIAQQIQSPPHHMLYRSYKSQNCWQSITFFVAFSSSTTSLTYFLSIRNRCWRGHWLWSASVHT